MKAHQRIVRELKEKTSAGENLFGSWWESINTDIKNAELKETDLSTAAQVIKEYEYLGTMPNAPIKAYGIFFEGNIGGVIVFGAVSPPSVSRSVINNKYSSKVIQLARGACVHWAHPHSASKLISFGLSEIQKCGYKIAIAYADPDAGEIGTVYQATNWIYCGLTAKRPDYLRPDGSRWMGHMRAGDAKHLKKTDRTRKGRYVYLMGTRKEKMELLKSLLWNKAPYPKRDALEVSRADTPCNTSTEGVGRFHDNAPI